MDTVECRPICLTYGPGAGTIHLIMRSRETVDMKYTCTIWLPMLILALVVAPAASTFACPCPPDCTACSAAEDATEPTEKDHAACGTAPPRKSCCAAPVAAEEKYVPACMTVQPSEDDTTCFCSPYSKPQTLATTNLDGAPPPPTIVAPLPWTPVPDVSGDERATIAVREAWPCEHIPARLRNCVFLC